jgi:hypothetical protein
MTTTFYPYVDDAEDNDSELYPSFEVNFESGDLQSGSSAVELESKLPEAETLVAMMKAKGITPEQFAAMFSAMIPDENSANNTSAADSDKFAGLLIEPNLTHRFGLSQFRNITEDTSE